MSLGLAIAVAILLARTVLPRAVNMLAKGTSAELYQLSVLAFCLVCGWIFGHLVSQLLDYPEPLLTGSSGTSVWGEAGNQMPAS